MSCRSAPKTYGTPADQSPMLVDTTTESNFVSNLSTRRCGESDLRQVCLNADDLASSLARSDVDKQSLACDKLGNLAPLTS